LTVQLQADSKGSWNI